MSEECYFCADDSDVLEQHHVVPKRHGGSDKPENLVTVCPTCHRKLERLYGRRFYDQLGVDDSVLGEAIRTRCPVCERATTYIQEMPDADPICARCGVPTDGNPQTATMDDARRWLDG